MVPGYCPIFLEPARDFYIVPVTAEYSRDTMAERRTCVNDPDCFCYVCGQFMTKSQRKNITSLVKSAYHAYFGVRLGDQDKKWAPHTVCASCYLRLTQWLHGKNKVLFAVPMVWREPKDHLTDCYFCMTDIAGYSTKSKNKIAYPDIQSAIKPVPHDPSMPVPIPPKLVTTLSDEESNSSVSGSGNYSDSDFECLDTGKPHLIEQPELNDLIRDLGLPKEKAELLASRLQQWNLLANETRVSVYRKRSDCLSQFYNIEDSCCYCTDIDSLMEVLGYKHIKEEWRLFIDSSQTSLKAILLHNGNNYPSVPLLYVTELKETYDSMKQILQLIQYDKYVWNICGDFKVIGLLMGMQGGFTKYCCFLCLWDSRATGLHYVEETWTSRTEYTPGQFSVKQQPLVNRECIYLPPLHIKLGLMKNFVKALPKDGAGIAYLRTIFPKLTDAKIKEGIFVGPQIRRVVEDPAFEEILSLQELRAWMSFKDVCSGFLGNVKAPNFKDLIKNMLANYRAIGARMSLKMHFLHSHIDFFPDNMGDFSDEHGERFHQDVMVMEQRYRGKYTPAMMGDFCWFLQRESTVTHKRKSRSTRHFPPAKADRTADK